jgi:hypothetical protein
MAFVPWRESNPAPTNASAVPEYNLLNFQEIALYPMGKIFRLGRHQGGFFPARLAV